MSILKVARLGHPTLRQESAPLTREEIESPVLQNLVDHMIETMREYEGVGLAAPQVHISKQIAVIEVNRNARYPDAPPISLTVLINPRLSHLSRETVEAWEGCLSIPDLRGVVPRHASLVCEGWDRMGKEVRIQAEGFFARVIQHECDHLRGRVYLDRMTDFRTLTHLAEFRRYWSERR